MDLNSLLNGVDPCFGSQNPLGFPSVHLDPGWSLHSLARKCLACNLGNQFSPLSPGMIDMMSDVLYQEKPYSDAGVLTPKALKHIMYEQSLCSSFSAMRREVILLMEENVHIIVSFAVCRGWGVDNRDRSSCVYL